MKIILGITFLVACCLFGIFSYFSLNSMNHCEYIEYIRQLEVGGVIIEKMDNTTNHNEHGFRILEEDKEYFISLTSDLRRGGQKQSYLWIKAAKGDSLFKKRNGLLVRLKSKTSVYDHELSFYTGSCY